MYLEHASRFIPLLCLSVCLSVCVNASILCSVLAGCVVVIWYIVVPL